MFMDMKVTFVGLGRSPETQGTEKGVERNWGFNGEKGRPNLRWLVSKPPRSSTFSTHALWISFQPHLTSWPSLSNRRDSGTEPSKALVAFTFARLKALNCNMKSGLLCWTKHVRRPYDKGDAQLPWCPSWAQLSSQGTRMKPLWTL